MTDEPRRPYSSWAAQVEVRLSLRVRLPGQRDFFLEGLRLRVDRYMYDRYSELGELDRWLQWQAVDVLMKNSTVNRVAIEVP